MRISTPSNDTPAEIIDLVTDSDSDNQDRGEDSWAAGFEDGPGRAAAHQLGREACVQILGMFPLTPSPQRFTISQLISPSRPSTHILLTSRCPISNLHQRQLTPEYRTHTSIYRLLRGQTLPSPSSSKRQSKPKSRRIGDTGEYADVTTHFKIPPHLTVAVKEFDSWATEFFKRGQGSSMVMQAAFGVFEGDGDTDTDMVQVQSASPAQEVEKDQGQKSRGMDRRREVARSRRPPQSQLQSPSEAQSHRPPRPQPPQRRDRSSSPRRHERARHDRNRHERNRDREHEREPERAPPSRSTWTPGKRGGGHGRGHQHPSSYTASASSSRGRL